MKSKWKTLLAKSKKHNNLNIRNHSVYMGYVCMQETLITVKSRKNKSYLNYHRLFSFLVKCNYANRRMRAYVSLLPAIDIQSGRYKHETPDDQFFVILLVTGHRLHIYIWLYNVYRYNTINSSQWSSEFVCTISDPFNSEWKARQKIAQTWKKS